MRPRQLERLCRYLVLVLFALAIGSGCGGGHWQPGAADFGDLGMIALDTDAGISFGLPARQRCSPVARPPTSLAIARVQTGGRSVANSTWRFFDASARNAVGIDHLQASRLDELPLIDDVISIKPAPRSQNEPLLTALRRAALAAQAELLLLYTFESRADSSDGLPPLDLVTIGMLPDVVTTATTRAHAVLVDARSGYIYAHAETDDDTWQLANHWGRRKAGRDSMHRAEARAFDRLIDRFEPTWLALCRKYRW